MLCRRGVDVADHKFEQGVEKLSHKWKTNRNREISWVDPITRNVGLSSRKV